MDYKILLDLLKEVREDQKSHGKELAKQSAYLEDVDSNVKDLKVTVAKNTDDIFHHIRRTDLLEALHKDNQKKIEQTEMRVSALEEPVKAKEWLKKHIVAISGVVAAIATVLAFILRT
jgi:phage terminase large subunit-like protein